MSKAHLQLQAELLSPQGKLLCCPVLLPASGHRSKETPPCQALTPGPSAKGPRRAARGGRKGDNSHPETPTRPIPEPGAAPCDPDALGAEEIVRASLTAPAQ
jgi:hypothetical protein